MEITLKSFASPSIKNDEKETEKKNERTRVAITMLFTLQ